MSQVINNTKLRYNLLSAGILDRIVVLESAVIFFSIFHCLSLSQREGCFRVLCTDEISLYYSHALRIGKIQGCEIQSGQTFTYTILHIHVKNMYIVTVLCSNDFYNSHFSVME